MKKKSALIFGLLLLILSTGVGWVMGETKELPRLTTTCETQLGGFLFGVDDGYSTLKSCPKKTRKVILGEKTDIKDNISKGEVLFTGAMTLLKDGSVMEFSPDYSNNSFLFKKTDRTVPVDPMDIVEWYGGSQENLFRTKNGDIYGWTQTSESTNGWVKTTIQYE